MSLDVMGDLETTGTKAGCCILSLGACSFDLNHDFYRKISHTSCLEIGLKDNQDTINWWNTQSKEARDEAFSGTLPVQQVLGDFATWLNRLPENKKQVFLWGNGADFDIPILAAAYEAAGMRVPWEPYNGRCYRTLKNLYRKIKMPPFEGVKHNALADAKMQAIHAREILRIHFSE